MILWTEFREIWYVNAKLFGIGGLKAFSMGREILRLVESCREF